MDNQIIFGSIGLGDVPGSPTVTAPPPVTGSGFFDKINNVLNVGTSLVKSGTALVSSVQTVLPGKTPAVVQTPVQQPLTQQQQQAQAASAGISTTAKVAIGVGLVALVGGIGYAVTRKKKKGK